MKLVSSVLTSGTSSPSIQIIGRPLSLPWSCQVQGGVMTKSPSDMSVFSPSTAV